MSEDELKAIRPHLRHLWRPSDKVHWRTRYFFHQEDMQDAHEKGLPHPDESLAAFMSFEVMLGGVHADDNEKGGPLVAAWITQ